jgi:hypothetical protein
LVVFAVTEQQTASVKVADVLQVSPIPDSFHLSVPM